MDEIYRLLLRTEGEQELQKLTRALEAAEKRLQDDVRQFGIAHPAAVRAAQGYDALAKSVRELEKDLGRTKDRFGQGQKFLQFGYLVDDLQYVSQQGLRPIINNIMMLSPAIGIALIAIETLYRAFKGFWESDGTKTQADRMKDLAEQAERSADAAARLRKEEEARSTIKTQQTSKSKNQKEATDRVNDAIAEAGYENVIKGMVETNRGRYEKSDPLNRAAKIAETERQIADADAYMAKTNVYDEAFQAIAEARERNAEKLKNLNIERENYIHERAERDLAESAIDPGKHKELIAAIAANPGGFGPGGADLLGNLRNATPGAIQSEQAEDAEWERFVAGNAEYSRKRKAREAAADADSDAEWDSLTDSNARWKQFKARKAAEQRAADADSDAEWDSLTDSNARWKQFKARKAAEQREASRRNLGSLDASGTSSLLERLMIAGGDPDAVGAALRERLVGMVGEKDADAAIGEAKAGAMNSLIRGRLDEKTRKSEVIDSLDFAKAIQTAVGGENTPKRQLEELQAIKMLLHHSLNRANGLILQK